MRNDKIIGTQKGDIAPSNPPLRPAFRPLSPFPAHETHTERFETAETFCIGRAEEGWGKRGTQNGENGKKGGF